MFSYLRIPMYILSVFLRFYHLHHGIWAAVECQLHGSGILMMLVKFCLCTSSSYAHLFMFTLFPPHHKWRSRDMGYWGHKLTWPRSQNIWRDLRVSSGFKPILIIANPPYLLSLMIRYHVMCYLTVLLWMGSLNISLAVIC